MYVQLWHYQGGVLAHRVESEGEAGGVQVEHVVASTGKLTLRELSARPCLRLEEKGYRIPEMHCEKHFEEWHDAPSPRPQAASHPRRDVEFTRLPRDLASSSYLELPT